MASWNPFMTLVKNCRSTPFEMEEIVMDHVGLEQIEPGHLSGFINLNSLYLLNNKLTALENLECNIRLKIIDARNNRISKLDIPKQCYVRELLLSNNCLSRFDLFLPQISHMKDLEVLDIRGNGLCQQPGFRHIFAQKFPSLRVINGIDVTPQERMKERPKGDASPKRKSQSMLAFLKSQSSGPADQIQKQASMIRQKRSLIEKDELEKLQAASALQKEQYQASAQTRIAPMPEALDFLGRATRGQNTPVKKKREGGARTRMFLKAPVFDSKPRTDPLDERISHLNRGMDESILRRQVKHTIVFPE